MVLALARFLVVKNLTRVGGDMRTVGITILYIVVMLFAWSIWKTDIHILLKVLFTIFCLLFYGASLAKDISLRKKTQLILFSGIGVFSIIVYILIAT